MPLVPARVGLVMIVAIAACGGEPPDLLDLSDQVAVVGQELAVELRGVDPDSTDLTYSFTPDVELTSRATMSETPAGNGLFRWTPVAADVGAHVFDFTVSDGSHDTTVSTMIDVRATGEGVPVFRQPLGSGRVVDLAATPCIDVDIVVEDMDSAQVVIAEEEPKIAGAMLEQLDGLTARWHWCPTPQQVADSDRYTLLLSADDGTNPKAVKQYILVLGGSAQTLIVNEIDYDNTGLDEFEYIEIYNPSSSTTSLVGLWVVLVNGATSAEYDAAYLGLEDSLAPGAYLVVAGAGVDVPPGVQKIDPGWTTDAIQNGSPDGVAIIDDVTLTVLDALSYEGPITAASIIGFPTTTSLVEGTALPDTTADSNDTIVTLCRLPNGTDTNNAASDWAVCQRTTGAANAP